MNGQQKSKMNVVAKIGVALSLMTSLSFAGAVTVDYTANQGTKSNEAIMQKQCEARASAAESIMRMYQQGISIKRLIQVTDENAEELPESVRDVVVAIYKDTVYQAAKVPKFSSPSNQENAVVEFSNKIMMQCISTLRGV